MSHLLFADDVLLFTKAKNSQIRFITDLFERFSNASGLKINLSKSRAFYSTGTPSAKIDKLTSISGIRSTTSLDKYLGFPILKGRAKRSDFHFIINKMQSRLASWKNRLLNKPGRLALASSVLSSIPTYYMQVSWLPQSICDSIDQTTRNFLWRDSNNKGIHLVGWDKIARPKIQGGLGIRPAREANICLLGKLVWDMVQSSNKLWVDLLSKKYTSGPAILHTNGFPNASPTWSSIIRAKNILKDGFSWRAGSGSSSFWFSPWSSLGYLGTLVPYVDIHDLHLTVRDVLTFDSPHSRILYTQLPPSASVLINNFHIRFNDSIDDAFIWPSNKNGSYTAKSGYSWLMSQNNSATTPSLTHSWTWIWKFPLPEKIKFLFWLACHNSVPTLSLIYHRRMTSSSTCPRCGTHDETFLHCVRDCNFSRPIWQHLGFISPNFFYSTDVHEWLKFGSSGSQISAFSAGVWWAWRHRNLMCLQNETWSINRLSFNIQSMIATLTSCFSSHSTTNSEEIHVKWNNNNHSGIILNVDGSCLGSPVRAGFGGIIRNDSGYYLSGFSGFIQGSSDILHAELLAIYQGLTLAKNMAIDELVCYSDSLHCINLIKGPNINYHVYAVLIQDIKELISQSNTTICHTFREGNNCVDCLAKLGASSDSDLTIHASPPEGLLDILRSDATGTFFLRE
ncbi:unnamed protein product [Trifolium pratense]|uniref:Uncharacterized protein n=1 Tax=Trifolium pratense TaxID=57577 RepID=A0ACB0JDY6_TRIPR|nr:unnamed protein product [Trifolium pratense]